MKPLRRQLLSQPSSGRFLLLDGQIDILLSTVPVGADGCIGGVPNFAPVDGPCQRARADVLTDSCRLHAPGYGTCVRRI